LEQTILPLDHPTFLNHFGYHAALYSYRQFFW
jgi:hypothetical protein